MTFDQILLVLAAVCFFLAIPTVSQRSPVGKTFSGWLPLGLLLWVLSVLLQSLGAGTGHIL
jgi:hypothetical protein